MKIVVAPASFKGSYPAAEVATMMMRSILSAAPAADVVTMPVSDGGEGFADCFLSRYGGVKVVVEAENPHGVSFPSYYALLPDGTAVVELAAAAGLHLAGERPDPSTATTQGVGTLIRAAVERGVRQIVVGLGGSSTNDAGCGLASALGVRFLDREGNAFVPVGRTLSAIAEIDRSGIPEKLRGIPVRIACDVTNPLSGPAGAACVYARQKGADDAMIALLDSELSAYSTFLAERFDFDCGFPGAGAAGGATVALRLFLDAEIERGIDTVLDMLDFDEAVRGAAFVFTGEGRLDRQSLAGKAVEGVARRALACGVPCIAFAGRITGLLPCEYPPGLVEAIALSGSEVSLTAAIATTQKRLDGAVARFIEKHR
ncbi:MAG: glycerate kinase [Candidatus Izemoplasmatales bacterium]